MAQQTIAGHEYTFSVRPNRLGGCYTWIGLKSVNEALYSMSENLISQDLQTCPRSHDLHYQVPGANIKTVSAMYVTH
jgi:hypothetical protein